jgi:hypothetical protein
MDVNKFISLRPFLFHLTDPSNLNSILTDRILKSSKTLVELVNLNDAENFLRTRRKGHKKIEKDNLSFLLRDQDPLYEKIVIKNLDRGMNFSDFVLLLNSRVFFWSTEKDLKTHYSRYEKQNEDPIILRISTKELFAINNEPQFCNLNSGAPRCSSYYTEGAPRRGENTFQYASDYNNTPSSVREVTFNNECKLPDNIFLSNHPTKYYEEIT